MSRIKQFKTFLLFVVAGPPIAALPLGVLFTIAKPSEGLGLSLLFIIFSYPVGVVPAALAGTIFVLLLGKLQKENSLHWNQKTTFLLGACCGLIGAIFFFILFSILTGAIPKFDIVSGLGIIFFPLSFLSGGICGVFSLRLLDEKITSFAEFKNSQIGSWLTGILLVVFFILALSLVTINDKT